MRRACALTLFVPLHWEQSSNATSNFQLSPSLSFSFSRTWVVFSNKTTEERQVAVKLRVQLKLKLSLSLFNCNCNSPPSPPAMGLVSWWSLVPGKRRGEKRLLSLRADRQKKWIVRTTSRSHAWPPADSVPNFAARHTLVTTFGQWAVRLRPKTQVYTHINVPHTTQLNSLSLSTCGHCFFPYFPSFSFNFHSHWLTFTDSHIHIHIDIHIHCHYSLSTNTQEAKRNTDSLFLHSCCHTRGNFWVKLFTQTALPSHCFTFKT